MITLFIDNRVRKSKDITDTMTIKNAQKITVTEKLKMDMKLPIVNQVTKAKLSIIKG